MENDLLKTAFSFWAKKGSNQQGVNDAIDCLKLGRMIPLTALASDFHEPMKKLIENNKHHKALIRGLQSMPVYSRALSCLSALDVETHANNIGDHMAIFVPSDAMIADGANIGTYDNVIEWSAFSQHPFPDSMWPLAAFDVTSHEVVRSDNSTIVVAQNGNVSGFRWGPCRLYTSLDFAVDHLDDGSIVKMYGLCKMDEGTC
jgi:hypothetical protein